MISAQIQEKLPKGYILRQLSIDDFHKGYLQLLEQLTIVGQVTEEQFKTRFNLLKQNPSIFVCIVIENTMDSKIVAAGNVVLESKFIRGMKSLNIGLGLCGHVEDIVVCNSVRGQGFGKIIIEQLVAISKQSGAYKVVLSCSESKVGFYEKCNFKPKSVSMAYYLE